MKKESNHIAEIERAIKKKYGDEAIQHPRKNWDEKKEKEYIEQVKELASRERKKKEKVEKVEKDGFLIGKKLLTKSSSRTCPVCSVYSFNSKDDMFMNKYDCCCDCYINYVERNPERWKSGWRPDK